MSSYTTRVDSVASDTIKRHPGNEGLISELATLLTTFPPPFIHIHDPNTPRLTGALLRHLLGGLSDIDASTFPASDGAPRLTVAHLDAIACFAPRLFFDNALNQLARWRPTWEEGCENWGSDQPLRFNDSVDGFIHGLQALRDDMLADGDVMAAKKMKGKKGKGKEVDVQRPDVRLILVIEHAERIKDGLSDLLIPLTRLAEISRVDVATVFVSELEWEGIKPQRGGALSPFRISVAAPEKQTTLQRMNATFAALSSTSLAHHPSLTQLYNLFASAIYDICALYTRSPDELAYIAAARWPGFVKPVLDAHQAALEEDPDAELQSPSMESCMRLIRHFAGTYRSAVDALYPRTTTAAAWAEAHIADATVSQDDEDNSGSPPRSPRKRATRGDDKDDNNIAPEEIAGATAVRSLPTLSRYILLASFLASTNPPKSDLRMFGSAAERRRKRKGGGAVRQRASRNTKTAVPQRLLGPTTFPLDRMMAILGFLLDAYDLDHQKPGREFFMAGSYTELELGRVHVYGAITELSTMHLLQRTSAPDKLDGPPTFKCGISYGLALELARGMKIPLLELLWDSQQ
ncbi:unnamed protein product [Peniophora sp. CBMAI 1063]|nr:unnamed protein product [Peniophora sp. CBMAI 1063]